MKNYLIHFIGRTIMMAAITIGFVSLQQAQAQTALSARSSDIKVLGTSNLHDWKMRVEKPTCNAQFTVKTEGTEQIVALNALYFTMPVKNLKSDESLMDSRTYSTLKAEKHTQIEFKLTSAVVTPQSNNLYLVKASGNLTIAGVSRSVTLIANGKLNPDKTITITGSQKIRMSEFQVKPPTFMLGALRVGDEVTIQYNLKF